MDINYLLGREQYALHLAETSASSSARVAHRAFAKAYGALIAATGFPHRDNTAHGRRPPTRSSALSGQAQIGDWESEGGSLSPEPDQQSRRNTGNIVAATQHAEDIALARGRVVTFS